MDEKFLEEHQDEMHFNTIIDEIAKRISSATKYTFEEIRKALVKRHDPKRPDFSIFVRSLGVTESPESAAEELAKAITTSLKTLVCDVKVHGCQVDFNLNKRLFFRVVFRTIIKKDTDFGTNSTGENKTVVVDFSSPNIAKRFHVGHFRTTVLGNFIVNLLRACKYKTVALNYLGDWGRQFGLVLLGYKRYGNPKEFEKNPLVHLFDVYVRISQDAKNNSEIEDEAREIFRLMEEERDEHYLSQWKTFRELSIKKYKELYAKLGIEFDVYSGESFYDEKAKEFIKNNPICTRDDDGSYIINCGHGLGNAIVQKSDGTTLYLARDIVAAIDRIETYNADKLLYVVASEQDLHFQQLFECLSKLGYEKNKFEHINYGLIKGMSTRNGQVHFLEDVIESSAQVIKERILNDPARKVTDMESTAMILAVTTLLVADFGAKRIKGYVFDIEQRANCENGSGVYLQYAHCRLASIEEMNRQLDLNLAIDDLDIAESKDVVDLAYKLLWFEYIVEQCSVDFEPSRIVVYLMDLAKTMNFLVGELKVKGSEENVAKARLYVLKAARIVISNALKLLGIVPLERM